mmetsp:Transcript_7836/g.22021  ORF Transcript_7836/g.22021 Transcript_7836/m.22021 type:complete len:205 (-) Transcript_7836:470-1084(-)
MHSRNFGLWRRIFRSLSLSGSARILPRAWCRALKHARRWTAGIVAIRRTSSASSTFSRSRRTSTGVSMSSSPWWRSSHTTASSRSVAHPISIAFCARTGGKWRSSSSANSPSCSSVHVSGTEQAGSPPSDAAAAASASPGPASQQTGARDTTAVSPSVRACCSNRRTHVSMSSTPSRASAPQTPRKSATSRHSNISASAGRYSS